MDELMIEGKRYISSKESAKVTGYAKDYIGQLCREGRVPARLVGRSWYVLESALEEHKSGNKDNKDKEKTKEKEENIDEKRERHLHLHHNHHTEHTKHILNIKKSIVVDLESPKYEAVEAEILPSLNRLRADNTQDIGVSNRVNNGSHESWKTWFDDKHIDVERIDNRDINVPIHKIENDIEAGVDTINRSEEILRAVRTRENDEISALEDIDIVSTAMRILIVLLFAVLAVVLIVYGTGYFDKTLISNRQSSILAGVSVGEKISQ